MTVYSVLILFYAICSFVDFESLHINRRKATFFLLIPAFFLVAFRDLSIGNDTYMYSYGFERINQMQTLSEAISNSRYELGYVIVNYVVGMFNGNYQLFQVIITAFIFMSLFCFVSEYSCNVGLSCYIFLTTRMMIGPMNTVRMWCAIAILLFSIKFIEKRKLIVFCIIVVCATLFHKTAIVFLISYPLCNKKNNGTKLPLWIIISSCVISVFGNTVFVKVTNMIGIYEGYLNSVYFNNDSNIAVILGLLIDVSFAILFILYKQKLIESSHADERISEVFEFNRISYVLFFLVVGLDIIGLNNTIMNRISTYYSVTFLCSIPNLVMCIKGKTQITVQLAIMFFLALQFYIVMIYRPEWNGVTPYRTFFR